MILGHRGTVRVLVHCTSSGGQDSKSAALDRDVREILRLAMDAPPSNGPELRAMGIRDKPIAPSSPWQNAYAERLIGTIRRECLDHVIIFGDAHLRRMLGKYAAYYNESRIHRSLTSIGQLSVSALSHHDLSSVVFIINIAESDCRHTPVKVRSENAAWQGKVPRPAADTQHAAGFPLGAALLSPFGGPVRHCG